MQDLLNEPDSLLADIKSMRQCFELALRLAECHEPGRRRYDALGIIRHVMCTPVTQSFKVRERLALMCEGESDVATVASFVFIAARCLLDETLAARPGIVVFNHLQEKLEINRMEKRLIGFVKRAGVPAWPPSERFIAAPYASQAQFAEVQMRYRERYGEHFPPLHLVNPDVPRTA